MCTYYSSIHIHNIHWHVLTAINRCLIHFPTFKTTYLPNHNSRGMTGTPKMWCRIYTSVRTVPCGLAWTVVGGSFAVVAVLPVTLPTGVGANTVDRGCAPSNTGPTLPHAHPQPTTTTTAVWSHQISGTGPGEILVLLLLLLS